MTLTEFYIGVVMGPLTSASATGGLQVPKLTDVHLSAGWSLGRMAVQPGGFEVSTPYSIYEPKGWARLTWEPIVGDVSPGSTTLRPKAGLELSVDQHSTVQGYFGSTWRASNLVDDGRLSGGIYLGVEATTWFRWNVGLSLGIGTRIRYSYDFVEYGAHLDEARSNTRALQSLHGASILVRRRNPE